MMLKVEFNWEPIDEQTSRSRVLGGWIILHSAGKTESMIFLPDKHHEWMIPKISPLS